MSIDRVATNNQTSYMLSQIAKANVNLTQSENQVASGKVSQDYAGIGNKTAALEAARAASDRAAAYKTNTQLAVTQTDLQDAQLTTLSGLAQQLQQAILSASSLADGTGLMETAKGIFDQATSILNSTDASGNFLYAGEKSDQKPFTATSLSDLAPPATVSSFFQDGTVKKSVAVGDDQTQQIGVLASDIGTNLMNALQALYQEDAPGGVTGALSGTLSTTQISDLSTTLSTAANTAYKGLITATALNGDTYNTLNSAVTSQQSLQNLYTGFVSNIEDADMATALTKLSNDQTALQAVLTVTSKLNDLSLLNYLPTTG